MLIDALTDVIARSRCVENFWNKLDAGEDAACGIVSSARPFFVAARFTHKPQPTLVVVAGEDAADAFARTLGSYLGIEAVMRYPQRLDHPQLGQACDPKTIACRLEAADALRAGRACVVVASARSLIRDIAPPSAEITRPLSLVAGRALDEMGEGSIADFDALKHALEEYGYTNTGDLDGPGTFGVHGGTIDVFPGNFDYPVRLDFFGDELEEIRRIVPATGQMISNLASVEIYAVTELPISASGLAQAKASIEKAALTNKKLREVYEMLEGGLRFDGADVLLPFFYKKTASLGDFAGRDALICLIEPRALFDEMSHAFAEVEEAFKGSYLSAESLYTPPAKANFGQGLHATYVSIMQVGVNLDDEVPVKRVDLSRSRERLFAKMKNWIDAGYTCLFSAPGARERGDIELAFVDHSIPIRERLDSLDAASAPLQKGAVNIVEVDIPLGIAIPKAKLVMASLEDLKGARSSVRARRTVDVTDITFPYAPGDYVVHEKYGIAYFKGLVLRELDGIARDYLELDYAEGDKLFLPVEQFDKVTRYVGPEGSEPRITRLNSADWSRAVTRARKASRALAFDIVEVYSRRAATKGYRFEVDTPWMQEMEEDFPFEETPDQAAAIADVKADMRSERPMDRLVCGDVGFGKTEVAIRAAFIAAQNGKQVMVLCPTTILAQQHFSSFNDRLAPYDLRVEALSRFKDASTQQAILEDFAKGEVSVLIGTHRLLSRDVNPHDLGLVIIDEEQRFGVGHKEQFKNLREHIDILTLSATPIPRTMQMAVSGVRDMSLILTPPAGRLPVKVHVGEWDPDLVSAAIRFELARDGQVYYVSNRVRTIDDARQRVEEAAPEARIGVVHGQMSKDELEHMMEDFAAGEIDVLVATTIIESGIDNPRTNTLIIEDAQRLGLSQMYQLKGRVGRSSDQAYAYFMFPEEIPLTEEARSRLSALSDHQELGSGMRIAMRDLEIRGAGNLLGAEQSGNMSAVGFDLFAQMLNQAVAMAREGEGVRAGTEAIRASEININIPGHMYLSQTYIADIAERVLWYRRLASAATEEAVVGLRADMEHKYPAMPPEAVNLFEKERLRAFAGERGITAVVIAQGNLTIEGIVVTRKALIPLKRRGARYLADKHKLIMPLRKLGRVDVSDEGGIAAQITDLLHEIYNDGAENDDRTGND